MGSYVNGNLAPGEKIRYEGKLTGFYIFWAVVLLLLAFVTFGFTLLLAIPLLILIGTTEIAVTDRRFIYKRGWLSQRSHEINLPKVEGVKVNRSLFGRMFGYGTVNVHGTGSGNITISGVNDPISLRRAIQDQT